MTRIGHQGRNSEETSRDIANWTLLTTGGCLSILVRRVIRRLESDRAPIPFPCFFRRHSQVSKRGGRHIDDSRRGLDHSWNRPGAMNNQKNGAVFRQILSMQEPGASMVRRNDDEPVFLWKSRSTTNSAQHFSDMSIRLLNRPAIRTTARVEPRLMPGSVNVVELEEDHIGSKSRSI